MANEFARNIRDAALQVTRALPTADGTVTSDDIRLDAGVYKAENYELCVRLPELSATDLPSGDTLTITIQAGASAAPTTSAGLVKAILGTGGTIAAQELRFRAPSNCPEYINAKFVAAGGTGDMSAKSAILELLF